jgi:hypothetical protein
MFIRKVDGPNSCSGTYIKDILDIGVRIIWRCKPKIIIECSQEDGMLQVWAH